MSIAIDSERIPTVKAAIQAIEELRSALLFDCEEAELLNQIPTQHWLAAMDFMALANEDLRSTKKGSNPMTATRLERLVHALNLLETAYTTLMDNAPASEEMDAIELIRHAKKAVLRAMKEGTP